MPTVLVVDDSAADRRLAGGLLTRNTDWNVIYANHGKAALAQFELHVPDIVVTDLQMPGMDGLKLVGAVKSDYPLVPVILMTGQGSERIAVQALQQGAASYVPKSSLAQDLQDIVKRVLVAARKDRTNSRLMHRITSSQISFVVDNDLSLILSLVVYLQQMLGCMRLADETERLRVGIALEEALLNAFYHGNLEVSSELREVDFKAYYKLARQRCRESPYRDRRIHVEANLSHAEAIYVIRDEGPGFDPASLPDPTDPANLGRPNGRGLLLMRTFMDEIEYNHDGNEVTLIKRRAPEPVKHQQETSEVS